MRQRTAYDNEILVSHRPAPSCITARDIIKAIDMARHQMPHHYAPALDAAQRLFRLATPEQIKQARIAEDEGQADLIDVLERLIHMAECNTVPGPNTLAQAHAALLAAQKKRTNC